MDSQTIKSYLKKKPSYLKWGNARVQEVLRLNLGLVFDLSDIRKAKKELKAELKRELKKETPFKVDMPTATIPTQEIVDQFIALAKRMGVQVVDSKKQEEEDTVFKRKRALKEFRTPSIQDQVGMHILLGCNHVPFHHKQLHRSIISMMKEYKLDIKGFHLLGDFLDLNPLSSHDKGRFTAVPGLTLDDEYQIGNDLLCDFDRVLSKDCWKTFMYGNHEDRYNRWMSVMDNAKTPLASPEDALRLWKRGYNVKTRWSQDHITIGNDFDIFHGIYYNVHNAKKHLDTFSRNCAYVHTHRVQSYREGKLAAHNIGTCANLNSKAFGYATRAMKQSWSNGFAILMVDKHGDSHLTQVVPDKNGNFYFGGKKY